MLTQLIPTVPLITPKGTGLAILVKDDGPEHHLIWVVIQDDTGEIWSWENPDVRATRNTTYQREDISEIRRKLL
jgi:hypothetical protein